MSNRDNKLLLLDMLESAEKIQRYTANLNPSRGFYSPRLASKSKEHLSIHTRGLAPRLLIFDEFLKQEMVRDAVARNFEIIGEASNRISADFKNSNPHVEWTRMTGLRHRIIHDYFGIDHEIMWTIIQDNITPLIDDIKDLSK
jgi:uncharacterized protein with HEPN domain